MTRGLPLVITDPRFRRVLIAFPQVASGDGLDGASQGTPRRGYQGALSHLAALAEAFAPGSRRSAASAWWHDW